jgi:hypothetical protein
MDQSIPNPVIKEEKETDKPNQTIIIISGIGTVSGKPIIIKFMNGISFTK